MRGQDDDGAALPQGLQPGDESAGRCVVEARERLVEQHEAGIVDERALERDALPHAARELRHGVVRAVGEAGTGQGFQRRRCGIGKAVHTGKERQVLASGEFGIEEEIVAQDADAGAQPALERLPPPGPRSNVP